MARYSEYDTMFTGPSSDAKEDLYGVECDDDGWELYADPPSQ